MGNINLRKLQVDDMAPIHRDQTPFSLFIENTIARRRGRHMRDGRLSEQGFRLAAAMSEDRPSSR
jgi:hypothetical protein